MTDRLKVRIERIDEDPKGAYMILRVLRYVEDGGGLVTGSEYMVDFTDAPKEQTIGLTSVDVLPKLFGDIET